MKYHTIMLINVPNCMKYHTFLFYQLINNQSLNYMTVLYLIDIQVLYKTKSLTYLITLGSKAH